MGMWSGIILMYMMVVRPLQEKYETLKEEMHQQIKTGFYTDKDLD